MKLHYRELGEGKPMMILHGLFGYSDNWQTHAKKLAEYYRVILVDLRNHGHTEWSDDFSYDLMADDIHELNPRFKLEDVILLGHSMGGKVAMRFAQQHEDLLEKLIIVDMGTKSYPMHHEHILAGIHSVKVDSIKARREAEEQMRAHIDSEGVLQFLIKNLYWKEKGKLAWRMNTPVLEREMPEILSACLKGKFSPRPYLCVENCPITSWMKILKVSKISFWIPKLKPLKELDIGCMQKLQTEFLETILSFCLR